MVIQERRYYEHIFSRTPKDEESRERGDWENLNK